MAIPEPAPPRRARGPRKPAPPKEIPSDPVPPAEVEPEPEEDKGPTPEEIERLKIATELNLYRYVGFMTVGSGAQKKKSMAVVLKDEEMHLLQLGDTIAGKVVVKAVSPSEITLEHVASKISQVIPATDEPATGEKPN